MNTKISKAIPNKFIISLDPSGQYVLNESGGKQYLYNLLTMENELLMRKKVQNVLWQKEWMFILTESTVTHRLNLSTHETYKYKRYNCDIFTSEFVETDTYIIR